MPRLAGDTLCILLPNGGLVTRRQADGTFTLVGTVDVGLDIQGAASTQS